jgi:Arc/MetJ family transcription regulator
MRTNIDIDDELLAKAMRDAGTRTKKETVERALKLLVNLHAQTGIRSLRGKIAWEGDLEESRLTRGRR